MSGNIYGIQNKQNLWYFEFQEELVQWYGYF